MRKNKDLLNYLKDHGLRMTSSKEALVQFFLNNSSRHIPLSELNSYLSEELPNIDRTTIYRNIEKFVSIGIIQELDLPKKGKVFQYVFGKKVAHYYICKTCGKMTKGNKMLFERIEKALKDIHGFSKANLSVLFYGLCY